MHQRVLRVALSFLVAAGAHAQSNPLADRPEVASAIRLLEAWIESQVAYRGQPGLSIGIVHDQQLVWARGFGVADVAKKLPATPQTIYRMASNTKLFTATAILQLRDAGKLQLDDPVSKHLPWFRIRPAGPDDPVITIRHLLTHTSGLPRESASPYWNDFKFPTRAEIIEKLPAQQATYPADTRWKYSNLAVTLSGEIVAAVSGQPYAQYIERHILAPLGMSSSSVALPGEHRARLATGYGRRMPEGPRAVMPFTDCQGISPAANLSSNVEDFARFASLQFRTAARAGGAQILAGRTLAEMHRIHWLQPDWKMGWGLGFQVTRDGDRTVIGHGGSLAGYRTQTAISPADKIAVLVMTNSDDGNPAMYVQQAFRYVAPALAKAAAAEKKPPVVDPKWTSYVGRYRSPWGDLQVLILNNELVMIDPTSSDPKPGMSKLVPLPDGAFRLEADSGFSAIGERVVFSPDRIRVGESSSRRLQPGEI